MQEIAERIMRELKKCSDSELDQIIAAAKTTQFMRRPIPPIIDNPIIKSLSFPVTDGPPDT